MIKFVINCARDSNGQPLTGRIDYADPPARTEHSPTTGTTMYNHYVL